MSISALSLSVSLKCLDSSVCIAMGYWLEERSSIPGWRKIFLFFRNFQTGSGAYSPLSSGNRGQLSRQIKWPEGEADHSASSSAKVKIVELHLVPQGQLYLYFSITAVIFFGKKVIYYFWRAKEHMCPLYLSVLTHPVLLEWHEVTSTSAGAVVTDWFRHRLSNSNWLDLPHSTITVMIAIACGLNVIEDPRTVLIFMSENSILGR
jgi:hypothetical protein